MTPSEFNLSGRRVLLTGGSGSLDLHGSGSRPRWCGGDSYGARSTSSTGRSRLSPAKVMWPKPAPATSCTPSKSGNSSADPGCLGCDDQAQEREDHQHPLDCIGAWTQQRRVLHDGGMWIEDVDAGPCGRARPLQHPGQWHCARLFPHRNEQIPVRGSEIRCMGLSSHPLSGARLSPRSLAAPWYFLRRTRRTSAR
jgi:hypothetical protein